MSIAVNRPGRKPTPAVSLPDATLVHHKRQRDSERRWSVWQLRTGTFATLCSRHQAKKYADTLQQADEAGRASGVVDMAGSFGFAERYHGGSTPLHAVKSAP